MLYRRFHSVHHELYVPYAFGALYNHWFEGLLLDTLGAAVAHSLSLMTIRQAVLLFTFSTFKTVDDHCGYALPFDPFQILFPNNSSYHDIHHRVCPLVAVCGPLLMVMNRCGESSTILASHSLCIGTYFSVLVTSPPPWPSPKPLNPFLYPHLSFSTYIPP